MVALLLVAAVALAQNPGPPGSGVTTVGTGASSQALPMLQSSAAEAGHVFKTSGGNLYLFGATNTGAAGYLLFIDGSSVPADGALTSCGTTNPAGCLKACYQVLAGTTSPAYTGFQLSPGPPISFVNGITVSYSSTGCSTKTAGAANVFFQAQVY
ncbi:MAG TPA: hypothetical protein VLL82_17535 [Mycobacterium sp.]|nr:hypothetical protein [Mycobacterium sp.]